MLVSLKYLDITNCSKLNNMPLEIECLTSVEIVLPQAIVNVGLKASFGGLYKKKGAKSNGGPSLLKEFSNLG